MEELYESDVMWPDDRDRLTAVNPSGLSSRRLIKWPSQRKKQSAPLNIPTAVAGCRPSTSRVQEELLGERVPCGGVEEEEEEEEEEEMVPPHVLMCRRWKGTMAFSVCTGNGRTLKGRDLSHVRDTVLRMTGFLER